LLPVIGYYESWADSLACHQVAPSDLPLSELTHLNYAFAYIDPSTYQLVTMDPATPDSLFQLTADTKQYNPNLKVWVSVGGWTFSDNDTATQPLFGEIAASAQNRQTFADNVVLFLNRYGFDG
jgi:chitinase